MDQPPPLSPERLTAQALGEIDPGSGGLAPAISPSTTYEQFPDGSSRQGRAYTRADNPTYEVAERLPAALEGAGCACAPFASGMAAAWARLDLAGEPRRRRGRGLGMRPQFTTAELELIVDRAHAAGVAVTAHAHGTPAVEQAVAGVDGIEHCSCVTDRGFGQVSEETIATLARSRIAVCPTIGVDAQLMKAPRRRYRR